MKEGRTSTHFLFRVKKNLIQAHMLLLLELLLELLLLLLLLLPFLLPRTW